MVLNKADKHRGASSLARAKRPSSPGPRSFPRVRDIVRMLTSYDLQPPHAEIRAARVCLCAFGLEPLGPQGDAGKEG